MPDYARICEIRGSARLGHGCANVRAQYCALRAGNPGGIGPSCTDTPFYEIPDNTGGINPLALMFSNGDPLQFSDGTYLEFSA